MLRRTHLVTLLASGAPTRHASRVTGARIHPRLIVLAVLALTACGRGSYAPAPAAAPFLVSGSTQPNANHVIPFFSFRKDGYNIGELGGRAGLIGDEAALYGATFLGGNLKCTTKQGGSGKGCGVIYELSPRRKGASYKQTILHAFGGVDGAAPDASLIMDATGNLYGTTYDGGRYHKGTVFKLSVSSSGYTESVLHSFGRGNDGAHPAAGLIDVNGTLYGTTVGGGTVRNGYLCMHGGSPNGTCGTAFSVSATTGKERVLHSFGSGSDGADPYAGLIDVNGTLYGTTDLGGEAQPLCGTVFSMSTTGTEHILHSFRNTPDDGCNPFGTLIELNGTLYGTTCCGGTTYGPGREGTVFSVSAATGAERVLHNFGSSGDGTEPEAGMTDVKGTLYGTTGGGGIGITSCCGVVFRLAPAGSRYRVVYRFKHPKDGEGLWGVLLYANDSLYGTTLEGGVFDLGTAFKLTL
jgi:uncharacterized repeat protein (TIGR03803 family)